MADCKHRFQDAPSVFSGTAQTRACTECERVEVMIASTGEWIHILEYLERRVANRSTPVDSDASRRS
jgi:hypothetical protein